MEKCNQDKAILIYGGGISYDVSLAPLAKHGISYTLLNPIERGINWDLYWKIHRNERTSLEDIITESASMRIEDDI